MYCPSVEVAQLQLELFVYARALGSSTSRVIDWMGPCLWLFPWPQGSGELECMINHDLQLRLEAFVA